MYSGQTKTFPVSRGSFSCQSKWIAGKTTQHDGEGMRVCFCDRARRRQQAGAQEKRRAEKRRNELDNLLVKICFRYFAEMLSAMRIITSLSNGA